MQVQPYLFFEGRCEEALEFYRGALGAEVVQLMRFKDSPEQNATCGAATPEKVMHCSFRIGETSIMASDGGCQSPATFKGFSLSLSPKTIGEAEKVFASLADGGNIQMPLAETFWSPRFGMVADRFGVMWMVNVQTA